MLASLLLALGALVSEGASPAGPPAIALDLDRSLELARAHSRRLQDRRAEVEIAGERRGEAFSRFLPRLGVLARYSRLSYAPPGEIALPFALPGQPAPEPARLGEVVEDQVSLRLTLDQPLFTGFALSGAWAAARHAEAAAKERLVLEDQELEVRVEEAYLTLLKARKLREVADQSVRQLEAHLADFERLLAEGAVTGVEVARGKARLASARLMQIQTGGAADLAQLALATLLGLDPDGPLWLEEPPVSFEPLPDAAAARVQALSRRPELAIAREGAAVREAQALAAGAPRWPQLALRASVAYEQPNARYFPPANRFDWSWDVSAVASYQLWDWGGARHAAKAAQGEASIAGRIVDEVAEGVRFDVERRRRDALTALSRVEAAGAAVTSAEKALERARQLCLAGQASCALVLDAESELTQARSERVQARADARLSRAQLRRASGG